MMSAETERSSHISVYAALASCYDAIDASILTLAQGRMSRWAGMSNEQRKARVDCNRAWVAAARSDPEKAAKIRVQRKKYYERNRAKVRAEQKAWHASEAGQKSRVDRKARSKKSHPEYQLSRNLKQNFGITIEIYKQFLAAQKGGCAICGQPETAINPNTGKPRRLAVDHHHATGAIRGLLCTCCNLGIGGFRGDADLMINAVKYLERHGLFTKEDRPACDNSISSSLGSVIGSHAVHSKPGD